MRKIREFVNYSEFTDVISSVQLIATVVTTVLRQPVLWKWIVVAAHNGLQGAMVCNLSGTDGTGALRESSRKRMLAFLQDAKPGDPVPDEWLADFNNLLKWIQEPNRTVGYTSWHPTASQLKHIAKLHELRNQFSHYVPGSWSIEAIGLPAITATALDGTEHLMLSGGYVLAQFTGNQRRALEHSFKSARTGLAALERQQCELAAKKKQPQIAPTNSWTARKPGRGQ